MLEIHPHAIRAWKHVPDVDVPQYRHTLAALVANAANLHIRALSNGTRIKHHHHIEGQLYSARASRSTRVIFTRTGRASIQVLDFVHRSNKFYYSKER